MCASTGDQDPLDGCGAAPTWLPSSQVDTVFELEKSLHTIGIYVVADGRTTELDRVGEHGSQGEAEALQLFTGKFAGTPAGADSCLKQALIGIDVPNPAEQLLVEQGGFDGKLSTAEEMDKLAGFDGHWFTAGGIESWGLFEFSKFEAAKTSGVDESDLATTLEAKPGMSMGCDWALWSGDEEPPGHAEMHDPLGNGRIIGRLAQFADYVFAGSMDA
jgi:hypothetical protein